MKLRKLERMDAPFMLEWMHDPAVVGNMRTDFGQKTIEDCEAFINVSQNDKENIHFAIVSDSNEYMGTVSLKNITASEAEFAITVRKSAMGKGYSRYGMEEIMRYAFRDLGLKSVYWCVSPDNSRAVHFYDKNGYRRVSHLKYVRGGTRQSKSIITSGIRKKSQRLENIFAVEYRKSFLFGCYREEAV